MVAKLIFQEDLSHVIVDWHNHLTSKLLKLAQRLITADLNVQLLQESHTWVDDQTQRPSRSTRWKIILTTNDE